MRVSDELIINAAVGLTNVFVYFKRMVKRRVVGGRGGAQTLQCALRRAAITGWRPLEDEANVFTTP